MTPLVHLIDRERLWALGVVLCRIPSSESQREIAWRFLRQHSVRA